MSESIVRLRASEPIQSVERALSVCREQRVIPQAQAAVLSPFRKLIAASSHSGRTSVSLVCHWAVVKANNLYMLAWCYKRNKVLPDQD